MIDHCANRHEPSHYIAHYIEEGKEGRKKRTNINNLKQPRRLRIILHALSLCSLEKDTQQSQPQYMYMHLCVYVHFPAE